MQEEEPEDVQQELHIGPFSHAQLDNMRQRFAFTHDEDRVFSQLQKDIVLAIIKDNANQRDIRERFNISSFQTVSTVVRRTALGFPWDRGGDTSWGHLSAAEIPALKRKLKERAGALKAVPSYEAMMVAEDLQMYRIERSHQIMYLARCAPATLERLDKAPKPICARWLHEFCDRNGIQIRAPEHLEAARQRACTSSTVREFFRKMAPYFRVDPHLLFNCDETSALFTRSFRVCVPHGLPPITEKIHQQGNITTLFCFNTKGWSMRPFMILKGLKTLPKELGDFTDHACFSSQINGWISKKLFFNFCREFVGELSHYRTRLPPHLQNAPATLVSDGHGTRISLSTIALLRSHNVNLVILPPHCSHVLQPFDVGLAAPFKNDVRKLIGAPPEPVRNATRGLGRTAQTRYKIVAAMLDGWRSVCNPTNAAAAWRATGLYPWNPEKALTSRFVRQVPEDEPAYEGPEGRLNIGSKCLTSPWGVQEVEEHKGRRIVLPGILERRFRNRADSTDMRKGVVFTVVGSLLFPYNQWFYALFR